MFCLGWQRGGTIGDSNYLVEVHSANHTFVALTHTGLPGSNSSIYDFTVEQ